MKRFLARVLVACAVLVVLYWASLGVYFYRLGSSQSVWMTSFAHAYIRPARWLGSAFPYLDQKTVDFIEWSYFKGVGDETPHHDLSVLIYYKK